MSVSIYDIRMHEAERLRKDFDAKDVKERESILRTLSSIAHEFAIYADDLDTFIEEKENEMVENGEI